MKKPHVLFFLTILTLICCKQELTYKQNTFPLYLKNLKTERQLSKAMTRAFKYYEAPRMLDNELYSNFRYTELSGLDYNNGNGTLSRRAPSKIIFENGKYYVWYTYRETPTEPKGLQNANDPVP